MEPKPPTLRLRTKEDPSNLTNTNDCLQEGRTKDRKQRGPSNDILFCGFVIIVSLSIIIYRSSQNSDSLLRMFKVSIKKSMIMLVNQTCYIFISIIFNYFTQLLLQL